MLIDLIQDGNIRRIKRFLDNCTQEIRDEHGNTALHIAVQTGNIKLIQLFLKDINVQNNAGITPLHMAVSRYLFDVCEFLIKNGANVMISSNDGWTCLHTASQLGFLELVQLLLQNGADVDHQNMLGLCPLHLSVSRGHLDVVELLVEFGASLSGPESFSPLHVGALVGRTNCVEYLLKKGLDLDLQNGQGNTPIHLACFEGEFEVVKKLVEYQADLTVRNFDDQNILDIAKEPMKEYIKEAYERQKTRDESCIQLYKASLFLYNINLPNDIKYLVFQTIAKGLTGKEWILVSKVLLDPFALKEHRLARDFIRHCSSLL